MFLKGARPFITILSMLLDISSMPWGGVTKTPFIPFREILIDQKRKLDTLNHVYTCWAAETPVKYERDILQITCVLTILIY